jgi:4-hydroxy 2-oxovalerate aldolase
MHIKILDCTLRDGGYYTNWDFDQHVVDRYFDSMNKLPVDYLEIGYRSPFLSGYHGRFHYCPEFLLHNIRERSKKKLVVILDEKNVRPDMLDDLLKPCIGSIQMVRIALAPARMIQGIQLAEKIKYLGFEVGFNVMYMSTWKNQKDFIDNIKLVDPVADYFYMVDSFGGVYPEDVRNTYDLIRTHLDCKIGFHGHNNLELALINSLTALECGVEIIDSTVTGMGRGAGNLKTELLLTALNQKLGLEIDFNALTGVTDVFSTLQKQHDWGTNLPYMVSGANSLPQKDVMEWVGKRYYSFNSIIRALQNQSKGQKDNESLPLFESSPEFENALIIGGGNTVSKHAAGIQQFLNLNPKTVLIHSSSKNATVFNTANNSQIFCLVGNEGHRMEEVLGDALPKDMIGVLPPFPRKMGTYIPKNLQDKCFELKKNSFSEEFIDSHTAIALQTVLDLKVKNLFVVGYDGYSSSEMNEKAQDLLNENSSLFEKFTAVYDGAITSLTPTIYPIPSGSLYALI